MSCAGLLPCRAGLPWWRAGLGLLCARLVLDDLGCNSVTVATVAASARLGDARILWKDHKHKHTG